MDLLVSSMHIPRIQQRHMESVTGLIVGITKLKLMAEFIRFSRCS